MLITDLCERERALDPAHSFIVQAPAGSGKTGLLTQRFLRLLSVVERPESVVAMTFTRKAATEMRDRIYDALTAAADNTPVINDYEERTRKLAVEALLQDRRNGWNLLIDPSRLQVQTIDALCSLLARQMPIMSGFGGQTKVIEDASELYRVSARRTLRALTEGEAENKVLFRNLALYFDNNLGTLEGHIVRMLEKRDQWSFLRSGDHPELVKCFCRLLEKAREALQEVFREQGAVDFGEITQAAIKALGSPERPSDLLYWLDYRIEHLLVDEFQDTSRAQYELVKGLTAQWSDGDNHSLFLVGDPMQSIYRFREAEVSLFLDCWEKRSLGAVQLQRVVLNTNFRSTPEILGWVEDKFSRIMPGDDIDTGAVQFRPSQANRSDSGQAPQCYWFIDDDGREEAARVVDLVFRAQKRGTVAILVRSRSHITQILPALREAQIRYEAIAIDRLPDQQHVIDVVSLTRAILHVADRVSWLACLRAPWCGLRLADLSALVECEPKRNLLDLISDPTALTRLSSDRRIRAIRFQEVLSEAVHLAGRVPLRRLVESAWLALGGPATLQSTNQRDDMATFLDLIEKAEQAGTILDFSLLDKTIDCLYAKPTGGEHRVHVMTIFEAKGLEFDTVIIPQLGKGTRKNEHDLLIWTEEITPAGKLELQLAAMPQTGEEDVAYRAIREAIKQKEEEELKRVFYVACTRAKNELYLLSSNKSKQNGAACREAGSGTFLKLIWDSAKPEFEARLRGRAKKACQQAQSSMPKTIVRRLPERWQVPVFEASVDWLPELRRETASSQKITYEWVTGNARHIGTVVHRVLNRIAADGLQKWTSARLSSSEKLIRSELSMLGVPPEEESKATSKVLAAVTNTIQSQRGRWILGLHEASRSEWPIAGRIQDKLVSGTVDRMFRDEDGRLWIVDFKTGEHEGANLEIFLRAQERRYRSQLDNYATLVSRIEKGPISLGLYFPLLDRWRRWEFAEEAVLTA